MMWNDGPEFISELTDPWAPHPVANRQVCNGGGGGGSAPNPPDYSDFNKQVSGIGNYLAAPGGIGPNLIDWATRSGYKLSDIADMVSSRAGNYADWATGQAKDMMSNWQSTYGPIFSTAAKNTQNFIQNLPATMESWAGKYGADAVTAIDQGKAALMRKLQGQGLTRPGVAQGAIDLAQGNQRALAGVAASEQGRMAARQYGDQLVNAEAQRSTIPAGIAGNLANQGAQYSQLQVGAPESAISTTAGAYAPGFQAMNTGAGYYGLGYKSMQDTYQNQLGQFNANQNASSNSFASTFLPLAAGIAGSVLAPGLGTLAAGGLSALAPATMAAGTQALSRTVFPRAATGGTVPSMAHGGVPMAGASVPPSMSPSGGARVDDVRAQIDGNPRKVAAINTGEFIVPRPVVDWFGEKFFQNLVMKSEKERAEQTVAAPQTGPPGAINPQPPMGAMA